MKYISVRVRIITIYAPIGVLIFRLYTVKIQVCTVNGTTTSLERSSQIFCYIFVPDRQLFKNYNVSIVGRRVRKSVYFSFFHPGTKMVSFPGEITKPNGYRLKNCSI